MAFTGRASSKIKGYAFGKMMIGVGFPEHRGLELKHRLHPRH